jgi:hypothetical protein
MSERTQTGETTIVRAAIYPAIGIARVGNSESEYFLAPEVTDPLPEPPGSYRDPTGALKRQAVRLRIYGLNAAGTPVAELTAENAEIRWTVHPANKNLPGTSSRSRSTFPRPTRRRRPGYAT